MRHFVAITLLMSSYSADLGKIYAAGSGSNMLSLPETITEIIELSGKKHPHVLYLGTASYDNPGPQKPQTQSFLDQGCSVSALAIAVASQSIDEMRPVFLKADIITVDFNFGIRTQFLLAKYTTYFVALGQWWQHSLRIRSLEKTGSRQVDARSYG